VLTVLFRDRESAERAYQDMITSGYDAGEVTVIMSDDTRKRYVSSGTIQTEMGTKAAKGAGVGGAIGGTVGAIAAAIAAVGTSMAIPGLGLVIAGPLAAALAGAGAGGVAGGLVGAMIGLGIPEERVREYEHGLKEGGIVMGITPRNEKDATEFQRRWKDYKGEQIHW
jgi:hypothetical protein